MTDGLDRNRRASFNKLIPFIVHICLCIRELHPWLNVTGNGVALGNVTNRFRGSLFFLRSYIFCFLSVTIYFNGLLDYNVALVDVTFYIFRSYFREFYYLNGVNTGFKNGLTLLMK